MKLGETTVERCPRCPCVGPHEVVEVRDSGETFVECPGCLYVFEASS